jgi:hypothetical protein
MNLKGACMEVTMRGALALRQLRHELQDGAGDDFPDGVLTELLVLHDVCKSLGLHIFQAREVLGEVGWKCVADYINAPACKGVNWELVSQVVELQTDR